MDVLMPDGTTITGVPEGVTQEDLLARYQSHLGGAKPSVRDTGLTGAAKSSIERIQADAYKTAGKLGILPIKEAEAESAKHEARAREIFQPTEKGFFEPTGEKFRELLGGSLPYIAAPVAAAGLGAVAVPSAPILAPAIAAGLAGTAQYTGSNLARQMEADKKGLEETNLGYAVAGAVPQALLDTYSLGMTPLIRRMFASAGISLAEKEAVEIAKRGLMSTLKDYGGVTAKTATREGLTEAAQQSLERLQAGLNITDAEARKEYFDSFIGGAVLGGTLAPIGRYLEGPARPTDQGIRPPTDQVSPLTDSAGIGEESPIVGTTTVDFGGKQSQKVTRRDGSVEIDGVQVVPPTQGGTTLETFKQPPIDQGLAQGQQLYQQQAPLTSATPIGGAIDTSSPLGQELSSTQAEVEALGKQNATLLAPEAATVQPTVAPEESAALALKLSDGLKQNPALRTQFEAAKQEFDTQGRLDLSQVFQTVLDTVPPVLTTPVIAPEVQQKVQQVRKRLIPALKQYGLEGTGLQIMDSLGNGTADAYYAQNLVTVALDSDNHLGALRHETIHALKNLNAFTPQEWQVLTNKAKSDWIPQFITPDTQERYRQQYAQDNNGDMAGFDEYLQEEGIAEAFKHFNNKLPAGMVGNLMYRLKQFFQSLKNTFSGQGFNTSDSIFRGIEATKYKSKAPATTEGKFAKREPVSKAPEGIPQNIWDLHEKARQADAESMGEITREKGLSRGAMKRNQTMAFKRLNKAVNDFVGEEKSLDLMVQMNQESSRREAGRFSFVRKAEKGEKEISTQNATGVKAKFDPLEDIYSIDEKAVLEAMEINPAIKARTIKAIKDYGFIPKDIADDQVIPLFKKNIVNNLLFLYNSVPAEIRNRSKLWYDGANKIAKQMGKEYDLTDMQVSGILAAMSPQKDWFQNVSMAERAIDILSKRGDMAWDENMLKYAQSYVKSIADRKEREKREIAYKKIEKVAKSGAKLKDMDIESAAAFVRAYDEAYQSRTYRIVTPEGGFGGLVMNMPDKKGEIKPSTMMWSTYDPIEKSVSIYRDGGRDNISQQLGFEHKIRSFYNNIVAPNSDISHVTIDTHAVAAGLFEALAGTDLAVAQNFGATGTADNIGVGGTYGLIADAYRDAAKQVGMKAREMQSITWEAVRGLFDENMKATMKAPIRGQWTKYKNGEQTFDEAREKIIKIAGGMQDPQWVGSDAGKTIAEGGSSYDKSYQPEGGVRLREEKDIREKITVNLSNVTSSIPGLNELYQRSMSGDEKAYAVLQDTAKAHLEHLLSGTSAKVKIDPVMGAYGSEREPAINASLAFPEADRKEVMAVLARFATNFNQQQVHVRQATAYPFGHDFGDGSYATNVWKMGINRQLTNDELAEIIKETGIPAITVAGKEKDGKTQWTATTYFVDPFENTEKAYEEYIQQVKSLDKALARVVGRSDKAVKPSVERLYVYGTGDGARLGYESIAGDVRPKQTHDTRSSKLIAEYFKGEPVTGFKQKGLNKDEIAAQKSLAQIFEALPNNDLKRPIVRRAYTALTRELIEQYKILPIKIEVVTDVMLDGKSYNYFSKKGVEEFKADLTRGMTEAEADSAIKYLQDHYGVPDSDWQKKGGLLARIEADNKDIYPKELGSRAMRDDVNLNNQLKVYKTSPDTFGPKGSNFKSHPLLKDSGLKDANGYPMLYNDLLRAVHDYYAHNLTPAEFGPRGELTAARNHLAVTKDPMAKWALIAETRLQNAWQNFTKGVEAIPLIDRPYATQKAALPPIQYALSGDPLTDVPMRKLMEELTPEQQLGSLPPSAPIATKFKFSLRQPASRIKAPDTPAFKRWFGNSKIVDYKGNPLVMFHGTARDITEFKPKQANAIFLTSDPTFAEDFGDASEAYMIKELFNGATPEERNKYIMDGANVARKNGDISLKEFAEIKSDFSQIDVTFGFIPPSIEQEVTYVLKNQLPTRQNIIPMFVSSDNPFDFGNKEQVDVLTKELNKPEYNRFLTKGEKKYGDKNRGFIERGHWNTIESEKVQNAIKKLGHDGFFVLEGGRKNLAVYDPAQVKSATGNIGTYSIDNPDIRFSLRDKNLQKFLEPSKEKGVWYHGTSTDFSVPMTKGNRHAFFLTQDPNFANRFAANDLSWFPGKPGIEPGANVMPVYIRVENPFDYENTKHIAKIAPQFRKALREEDGRGKTEIDGIIRNFKEGKWAAIEHANDFDLYKKNGFDSFYVYESGKNIAVLEPNQVKSAVGNRGTFDITSPDIRFSLRDSKKFFERAEQIPEPEGVAIIRENWIGGVSGLGDRDGVYDLYRVQGGKQYTQRVQNFIRKELGENFKGYRLMSKDEFEELKTGAMGSQFVSFTFNPKVAEAFKNLPSYAKRKDLVVAEMDLTPEHVNMIGHQGEQEIVIDYGQGYNPDAVKEYKPDAVLREPAKIGINVNQDGENRYADKIVDGEKTYETRESDSLKRFWVSGDRVAIVRTGEGTAKAIGEATIGKPVIVTTQKEFDKYRSRTLIPKGSKFDIKEGGVKYLYPIINPERYDSEFDVEFGHVSRKVVAPNIRFALNAPPKQLTAQTPVYTAGQQVQQAASAAHQVFTTDPNEFWTKLRINWVDPNAGLTKRLQNLPIFDSKGQLRADMLNRARAQSINLIKNGLTGGVPVLNTDGSIIIKDDAVNNLANSQLLADGLNNNQYVKDSGLDGRGYVAEVARALRGEEIMQEDAAHNAVNPPSKHLNREKQVDAAQIAWAKQQMQNVPELRDIFSIWKNVNTALVDLWEKVGLLDAKTASEYRGKKSYVSLAASIADMEERMGEGFGHAYTGTKGVKKIQRLEGSDLFRNIWENVSKQYASMVAGAYQNQTRKVAVEQLGGLGLAKITNPTDPDINLRYKDQNHPQANKEGIVSVVVDNPNDVAAFESMHYQLSPIMKAMSGATGVLRAGALLNPMFWIRQLIRDPIQASLTNSPIVTPLHSAKEYLSILRRDSAEARLLAERGVIGPVDSTLDLQDFLETAGQKFAGRGNTSAMLSKLMEMHEASDAATRVAIYKKAKQEALARGLNDVDATNEAVYKARESINFAVRGNSPTLAALRHMTPFLSAAISSLDVLYKAATGYGLPPKERAEARAMFKRRAMMMGAMSIAYAMMMQDDEEYKKVPDYIRDSNWLIHNPFGDGFIKIPTPFEVGFLLKTIPEGMVRYISGNSTGKQVVKSYLNGLANSLPGDAVPLPQLIKPAVEAITNYSLFTFSPIESIGESKLPVELRGRRASETAKALSEAGLGKLGLSPAKLDHLIQGYFAEWGTFTTFLVDKAVTEVKGETPMDKNLAQQPFFKSFITDPTRDKVVGDFYELYRTANEVSAAVKDYKSSGAYEAIKEIYADEDKVKLLRAAPALNRIADNMGKINSQIRLIQNSQNIPPDERLRRVNELQAQLARVARQHLRLSESLGI